MWCTVALLWISYVAGRKCPGEVLTAGDNLAQLRLDVINAAAHCKIDPVKCGADLGDFLKSAGAVILSFNDAAADGFFYDVNIAHLGTLLGNATKSVSKATEECSNGDDLKCKAELMKASSLCIKVVAGITKFIYHCSSTEPIARTSNDSCAADLEEVTSTLEQGMDEIISVISECLKSMYSSKCLESILATVGDIKNDITEIETSLTHCSETGSDCGNEVGKVVIDLDRIQDDISRSMEDCMHLNLTACLSDLATVSNNVLASAADIVPAILVCATANMTMITF